jgi:hypothetical protein
MVPSLDEQLAPKRPQRVYRKLSPYLPEMFPGPVKVRNEIAAGDRINVVTAATILSGYRSKEKTGISVKASTVADCIVFGRRYDGMLEFLEADKPEDYSGEDPYDWTTSKAAVMRFLERIGGEI